MTENSSDVASTEYSECGPATTDAVDPLPPSASPPPTPSSPSASAAPRHAAPRSRRTTRGARQTPRGRHAGPGSGGSMEHSNVHLATAQCRERGVDTSLSSKNQYANLLIRAPWLAIHASHIFYVFSHACETNGLSTFVKMLFVDDRQRLHSLAFV